MEFPRFFSVDSAKAVKAQEYGVLNAINYMSPADSAGHGNLCPHASAGCIALCLGLHSGQASMVPIGGDNSVRASRRRKVAYFMKRRAAFLREAAVHIAKHYRYATARGMALCIRMNGATDIAFERIRFVVDAALCDELEHITGFSFADCAGQLLSLVDLFRFVQFVDYTKNPRRFDQALPANYDLTFSRSETNEPQCLDLLSRGINVAVVFDKLPATWHGFTVIDGDRHDLRHLDPKGGFVVGLLPKGSKAKRDASGFVVRNAN